MIRCGIDIVCELDLHDRTQTVNAHADGGRQDAGLGNRRVERAIRPVLPLQTLGAAEHTAKIADVLAEDDDPVIFLEPKRLYNGPFNGHHDQPATPWTEHPSGEVPDGYYTIPLSTASVVRAGEDVTVLTYGTMVHVALEAVTESGVDAEVLDLRTLVPIDIDTIVASVTKTGRCVIVHEATRTSGFGAELSALVQENCFYSLETPIVRVTGWDTPYPHSLEWEYFPGPRRVAEGLRKAMES